ncbi:sterol desaturase family protein [Henriciella sp. AS95]|uniref:sterol desaturase family protein n=1 Tax=Henriciella sp. AS95 TaxID=3135782 RepID=UPI00317CA174
MFGLLDYFFFAVFGMLALMDFVIPARTFPTVRAWRLKGLASAVMYFFVAGYSPFIWDAWLSQYQLIDGSAWPVWIAGPAALLLYQLGVYAWHRTMHNSDTLWRIFHQTHHSAERVDIWGALYFHPLDVVGFAFIGSLALTLILGVSPEAIMFAVMVSTFCGLFQHANVRTPHWLGFIITRPESHALHHERGVHRYNYGDIPIWDMLFGTFRNPKQWEGEAGLVDGGSDRFLDLLTGRDITKAETRRGGIKADTVQAAHFLVMTGVSTALIGCTGGLLGQLM